MPIIVRPIEGLAPLENRPTDFREYAVQLREWRRRQIEVFWQQLASELQLTDQDRKKADAAVVRLAAVGVIILPDWLVNFERLLRLKWLIAWVDTKLKTPWVPPPQTEAGPAQPWHLAAIKKPPARTGAGVTIGILDTGYDANYCSDLPVATFQPIFGQYTDPPPGSSLAIGTMTESGAYFDTSGIRHGSKVCALIAGQNGGVAPKAKVLVASIKDNQGLEATRGMFAVALNWLLEYPHPAGSNPDRPVGCDIITTSIAASAPGSSDVGSDVDREVGDAAVHQTLVVAAIGNAENLVGLNAYRGPGASGTVIGVGAVDQTLTVCDFSAYGVTPEGLAKPDLVAPGRGLEFPLPSGDHDIDEGTSYAAPIVAGAAALILEATPALRSNVTNFRNAVLGHAGGAAQQVNPGDAGQGLIDLTGV